MKLFDNKKGQFYIVIALILIVYAFSIARPPPTQDPSNDIFTELYRNFLSEGPIVVNNAIYTEDNVSARLTAFAEDYALYARSKSPNFRLIYILKDEGKLVIGNNIGISINVTAGSTSYNISHGTILNIPAQDITLDVEGISYPFDIGAEEYQLKALFRQKTDRGRRVFVKD